MALILARSPQQTGPLADLLAHSLMGNNRQVCLLCAKSRHFAQPTYSLQKSSNHSFECRLSAYLWGFYAAKALKVKSCVCSLFISLAPSLFSHTTLRLSTFVSSAIHTSITSCTGSSFQLRPSLPPRSLRMPPIQAAAALHPSLSCSVQPILSPP